MTQLPVQVVVVDDHHVVRAGLCTLFADVAGFEVVAQAADTESAVASVLSTSPDVVLMDLGLPGAGGVAATRRVLAARPLTAVLVMTMYDDDVHVRQALAAGARGYLLKDADPETIVRTVRSVLAGQLVVDAKVAPTLVAGALTGPERPFPSLTERELEILDRIARGLGNSAIAVRMGISIKTVQNNVSSILLKLGARDRAALVALARDAGVGAS